MVSTCVEPRRGWTMQDVLGALDASINESVHTHQLDLVDLDPHTMRVRLPALRATAWPLCGSLLQASPASQPASQPATP